MILSVAVAGTAPAVPSLATAAPDVVAYYSKNQGGFLIGNYLGAAALIPAILVVVYLTVAIRDAEPGRGYVWLVALVGNAAALAAGVGGFALLQTAAVVAPGSTQLVKAINDAGWMVFGLFFLPQAVGVAALASGFLRTGTMPRLIGWAGVPVVVAMLVASFGTVVRTEPWAAGGLATLVALGFFVVWFLAISVVLLVRPAPQTAPSAG